MVIEFRFDSTHEEILDGADKFDQTVQSALCLLQTSPSQSSTWPSRRFEDCARQQLKQGDIRSFMHAARPQCRATIPHTLDPQDDYLQPWFGWRAAMPVARCPLMALQMERVKPTIWLVDKMDMDEKRYAFWWRMTGRDRLSAEPWLRGDNRFGRLKSGAGQLGFRLSLQPWQSSWIGLPNVPLILRVA